MDKKALIENLVCEAHGNDHFTGARLFVENGQIVSAGAVGLKSAGRSGGPARPSLCEYYFFSDC